jgi:NAD dependent epimerase/dehydratase family enzyme
MSSIPGRVVLGGATGFMGRALREKYRDEDREVITISRRGADLTWEDQRGIDAAVDGSALVVGLAGRSVDCRYTRAHRAEIFSSRLRTTRALHRAVSRAAQPPALWANSSTATIYRHATDRPQTESDGEIGTGFSVEVARAWEAALFEGHLPRTRRVALRTAIVLGDGGVLATLRRLARYGISGTQSDGWWPVTPARRRAGTAHDPGSRHGRQRFSWIHLDDVLGILDVLEATPSLSGPVNLCSPHPEDNAALMRAVRETLGIRWGVPTPRWMLELGAIGLRTETELILKSRWVLPERLLAAGYEFRRPLLRDAVAASFAGDEAAPGQQP